MRWMKRRALAVLLGLGLGWYVASFVGDYFPSAMTWAENTDSAEYHGEVDAADLVHHDKNPSLHGKTDHIKVAVEAVKLNVEADDVPFIRSVLFAVAILFATAPILGSLAVNICGPEPADPVADDPSTGLGCDSH